MMKWAAWIATGLIAVLAILAAVQLFSGQNQFKQAANQCERDCMQDSGGLEYCRQACLNAEQARKSK